MIAAAKIGGWKEKATSASTCYAQLVWVIKSLRFSY